MEIFGIRSKLSLRSIRSGQDAVLLVHIGEDPKLHSSRDPNDSGELQNPTNGWEQQGRYCRPRFEDLLCVLEEAEADEESHRTQGDRAYKVRRTKAMDEKIVSLVEETNSHSYQVQPMLLEQQNNKRMRMARQEASIQKGNFDELD